MNKRVSKWGRSDGDWDELTVAGEAFLRERARLGRLTSYTEFNAALAHRTGQAPFDFDQEDGRAAVGHLLGLIVRSTFEDVDEKRLMLSALVVYLNGNDAGPGFYELASDIGLLAPKPSASQRDAFWTEQVRAIFVGKGRLP